MTRKIVSLLAAIALICALAVPVSAAESDDGTWVELLSQATVNNSGSNYFSYTTSKTITVSTPSNMRICAVDMLISYTAGTLPTKVEFYNGNGWAVLTVREIGPGLARVYGTVRATFYKTVQLRFTRSATSTTYAELLSLKVSRISTQNYVADADVYIDGGYVQQSTAYELPGAYDGHYSNQNQVRINVYDWANFDQLTIWGSSNMMPINSIRATVGTLGLPIQVSYMDMSSAGSSDYITGGSQGGAVTDGYGYVYDTWTDTWEESNEVTDTSGKWLYCVTVDLTGVDRTMAADPLYVYMTGFYDEFYGYSFTLQYVNGTVIVPDTSEVTWWNRFTSFMTELFGGDTYEADDFSSEMESQGAQMDDMVDQMDDVTRPDVNDIDIDLTDVVSNQDVTTYTAPLSALLSNSMFFSMTMISLTLALVAYVLFGKR